MNLVVVNTYAGSLLEGARKIRAKVDLVLEDAGYGAKTRIANFPDVRAIDERSEWPERMNLRDRVVIAHPPCAAFSSQNTTRGKGLTDSRFERTRDVIEWSLRNEAAATLVESVVPAMVGAREEHDAFANRWGYRIFRVLQNAGDFGLPQWRPRFWVVYSRIDAIHFKLEPRRATVAALLNEAKNPEPHPAYVRRLDRCLARARSMGISDSRLRAMLEGRCGYGSLPRLLARESRGDIPFESAKKYFGLGYEASVPWVLDPNGVGNTFMHDHVYYSLGRLFAREDYLAYMGFPRSYRVVSDFGCMLSKGVCPPVAAWMLASVRNALAGRQPPRGAIRVVDGGAADFSRRRGDFVEGKAK